MVKYFFGSVFEPAKNRKDFQQVCKVDSSNTMSLISELSRIILNYGYLIDKVETIMTYGHKKYAVVFRSMDLTDGMGKKVMSCIVCLDTTIRIDNKIYILIGGDRKTGNPVLEDLEGKRQVQKIRHIKRGILPV